MNTLSKEIKDLENKIKEADVEISQAQEGIKVRQEQANAVRTALEIRAKQDQATLEQLQSEMTELHQGVQGALETKLQVTGVLMYLKTKLDEATDEGTSN